MKGREIMARARSSIILEEVVESGPFPIRFPEEDELDQHEEWCEAKIDGTWCRIRFHDYGRLFETPGLYEAIFHRSLRCTSPTKVVELLKDVLQEQYFPPEELKVLDVGAGNGMVGEALHRLGSRNLTGIDILPEAKKATLRDRPWVYNDYFVADLTDLPQHVQEKLRRNRFNCLTAVASLGFDDLPTEAFRTAYNLIEKGGWIVFNIKEDFLTHNDLTGFGKLVDEMVRNGVCQLQSYKRYCHRLNVGGKPLFYIAVVGEKLEDIT